MTRTDDGEGPVVSRRAVAAGLGLAYAMAIGISARAEDAQEASEWSVMDHGRVRLVDAGPWPQDDKQRLVGIEVQLDPGYLTYWRSPGEAGLPPTIRFDGSSGLKSATVLFPAPGRYSEDGIEANGYKDAVTFPVLIVPDDEKKPVSLHMTMEFGICERQCMPAKAHAELTLAGDGKGPEAALVRTALDHVPAQAKIGGSGPLAITGVEGQAGDAELTVMVRCQGADVPLLFAEAPDPWFVQPSEGLWLNSGALRYKLKVLAMPPDPAPLPLRLTLVGAESAIEVPVTLDPPPKKP